MAFKRSDFNALVDEVNSIITNAPGDCEALPPIDHVPPNTVWRKSHIRELRDALKATCEDISFEDIDPLWRQSTLDEIRAKFSEAWCDCEDCDPFADIGTSFILRDFSINYIHPCESAGSPPSETEPLAPIIDGMTFGLPGIINRRWRVDTRQASRPGFADQNWSTVSSGVLNCDGTVDATTTSNIFATQNTIVFFGQCGFVGCNTPSSVAQCQGIIDSLFVGGRRQYRLVITAGGLAPECQNCG